MMELALVEKGKYENGFWEMESDEEEASRVPGWLLIIGKATFIRDDHSSNQVKSNQIKIMHHAISVKLPHAL